jgi:hypothetical protein
MKYFAELDSNKIVTRVIVANSLSWCVENLGGTWIDTGENIITSVGDTYNELDNKFVSPFVPEIEAPETEEITYDN